MKMSMMAAIHEKLLKLNASSVAKISTGFVVNLASNDVERFEDACEFWMYLIFAPVETVLVLVCVSLVLGFLPAISGIGCILILGPLQGLLSKHIAKYRVKAAQFTDKRINLMGELISGILAVKMLGWEDPLLKDVASLRRKEHNLLKKMNYTVANIFALSGYIQTIMVCVTFVVVSSFCVRVKFAMCSLIFSIVSLEMNSTFQMYSLLSVYSICHGCGWLFSFL